MGDPGKGLVTLIITAGLVLMIYGYRTADYVPVYVPLPDTGYLNNLLMLVAIVLLGAGVLKGVIWTRIRHPQFLATMIWATAHLLVNGDLAAILLFGSMWLWAAGSILLINAQEGGMGAPAARSAPPRCGAGGHRPRALRRHHLDPHLPRSQPLHGQLLLRAPS